MLEKVLVSNHLEKSSDGSHLIKKIGHVKEEMSMLISFTISEKGTEVCLSVQLSTKKRSSSAELPVATSRMGLSCRFFVTVISDFRLYAAHSCKNCTYCTNLLTLYFGLKRKVQWAFIIAELTKPIFASDIYNISVCWLILESVVY